MARRHHRRHMKHRRNPSGKEAGKAALTILAVGAGAALVNKYMNDMTVVQTGQTQARMTVKTAKAVQVGVGLVAGIALAAYNKPVLGAAVGAALVAPAAEPLYTALRAPATAGSAYLMGSPVYR